MPYEGFYLVLVGLVGLYVALFTKPRKDAPEWIRKNYKRLTLIAGLLLFVSGTLRLVLSILSRL